MDPHNEQEISAALLKLLSEKNLWLDCRNNGWKNIHLFSWPEHCRTYLTRVAACRMRHPQWKTDTPEDDAVAEGSLNDSLKDVQDMSLRLSVDGEMKSSLNGSLDLSSVAGSDPELQEQVDRILSKIRISAPSGAATIKQQPDDNLPSKYPKLRRRRKLIVIALDCYDSDGAPDEKMIPVVQKIIGAVRSDSQAARVSGFGFSTAMPVSETLEFLKTVKIQANELDVLICSSGSEVYYPGTYADKEGNLFPDPDYAAHIDYRWECEGLKSTIRKLSNEFSSPPLEEDLESSNAHCISYLVNDRKKVYVY